MSPAVGTLGRGKLSSEKVKGEPRIERAVLTVYYYIIQPRCNCFNGVLPCEGSLDIKSMLDASACAGERFGHRLAFHRS